MRRIAEDYRDVNAILDKQSNCLAIRERRFCERTGAMMSKWMSADIVGGVHADTLTPMASSYRLDVWKI